MSGSNTQDRDRDQKAGLLIAALVGIVVFLWVLVPIVVTSVVLAFAAWATRAGWRLPLIVLAAGCVVVAADPSDSARAYLATAPASGWPQLLAAPGGWRLAGLALWPVTATVAGWLALGHTLARTTAKEEPIVPDVELHPALQIVRIAVAPVAFGVPLLAQSALTRRKSSSDAGGVSSGGSWSVWERRRVRHAIEQAERFVLGVDERGKVASLDARELTRHVLMLGATGSGKTTTLTGICLDAVAQSMPVILIDLKGDPAFCQRMEQAAAAAGKEFSMVSVTPGERCDAWQPLLGGDPKTRGDKLLALSEWTEPYYRFVCERFVLCALHLLDHSGQEPTIMRLIELLDDPEKVSILADKLPDEQRSTTDRYLQSTMRDQSAMSALRGMASRLGSLTDPSGPLHDLETRSGPRVDVARTLATGGVCVFSLNSSRGANTASQVAALALLDIMAAAGDRIASGATSPVLVAIDEFSALNGEHVLGLLARARSAGVGVVLATQDLADLARVDPHFADQVIGNTATKIIHRQDVPESAERLAMIAGTHKALRTTWRTADAGGVFSMGPAATGDASNRVAEEFLVHPNTIKQLPPGSAIVIRKDPVFSCVRVRVVAR